MSKQGTKKTIYLTEVELAEHNAIAAIIAPVEEAQRAAREERISHGGMVDTTYAFRNLFALTGVGQTYNSFASSTNQDEIYAAKARSEAAIKFILSGATEELKEAVDVTFKVTENNGYVLEMIVNNGLKLPPALAKELGARIQAYEKDPPNTINNPAWICYASDSVRGDVAEVSKMAKAIVAEAAKNPDYHQPNALALLLAGSKLDMNEKHQVAEAFKEAITASDDPKDIKSRIGISVHTAGAVLMKNEASKLNGGHTF